MFRPDTFLQYVHDMDASVAFYTAVTGAPPSARSPAFALFPMGDGCALGLWQRDDVQPPVVASAGGAELAMVAADPAAVEALHARWAALGVEIVQAPVTLAFGHTFVAADPDGHRLRVFSKAGGLAPRD